jgi:signal transduction histidine kinase
MATSLLLLLSFVIAVMLTTLIISSIMTEREQSQRELQERHDWLEMRVVERTADLSFLNTQLHQEINERKIIESELAQARDQALEALRLKSQILANVSHDARTPLSVITLYTQILQKGNSGPLTEKQSSMLETILNAARELLHFIENLLDEAQLQSHDSSPKVTEIDLRSWFAERIHVLQPIARRKGLALNIEIAADMPPSVGTDPEGLKQIFTNLVDNAIKFTTDGMILIKIFKSSEQNWAIQVEDSGCGIPLAAQESIFEAFWQVDGSSTRMVNRGVGLGLSIVKQRLALLGGSISLKSEPNEGSVFTAVLPLAPINTQ